MKSLAAVLSVLLFLSIPVVSDAQAFSKDDPVGAEQVFVTTEAEGWVSERSTYTIINKWVDLEEH